MRGMALGRAIGHPLADVVGSADEVGSELGLACDAAQGGEEELTGELVPGVPDLLARRPINSDLPWWNLPETMRAAEPVARRSPPPASAGNKPRMVCASWVD